jgi:hypothetical protein
MAEIQESTCVLILELRNRKKRIYVPDSQFLYGKITEDKIFQAKLSDPN